MAFKSEELAKAYWRENIGLVLKLLAVWFIVSFGFGIILVDWLNQITFLALSWASGSLNRGQLSLSSF